MNTNRPRAAGRMPRTRGWALLLVFSASLTTACGDDPPDREIQQAQQAIDAARSAGAGDYAREEFTAAEKALATAREAVLQRDYRLALTNALDSRERAQTAAKETADQKAIARLTIERTLRETAAAVAQARARLKEAETTRVPRVALNPPRRAIGDADRAVQEARAAFDGGDYAAAKRGLDSANARLAAARHDLDTPRLAPSRRRR